MEKKVRVRFAPSPTGPLHLGGVRTALFNYLFAKKHKGDCILRIEDTDQNRYIKSAEEYILKSLKWCNITFDESYEKPGKHGPYRQSERAKTGIYKKYAFELIKKGYAYYAFDTPEELETMRENLKKAGVLAPQYNIHTRENMKNSLSLPKEKVDDLIKNQTPFVIRIKIPRNENIKFYDEIRGWIKVNSNNLDDKILYKSDGMPTYHLANVVDDIDMNISHVIRGEEWLPSAPLHILLYNYLGQADLIPKMAHLPLILKPSGQGKLSKRDGEKLGFPVFPIKWENSIGYKEEGYFPEAFINMLAFLGWNPGTKQEIFSLEELIENFSFKRVGKSGSKFDPEKAKWFNHYYLANKSNKDIADLMIPILKKENISVPPNNKLDKICTLLKERAVFVSDILSMSYLFDAPKSFDEKFLKKKWNPENKELIIELKSHLKTIKVFNSSSIQEIFNNYISKKKIKISTLLPVFRLLITGLGFGPSMFDICEIIGKENAIDRLERGLKKISNG